MLPCMGCIGMCGAIGYGFSAVLVINKVSVLAILVINRVSIFFTLVLNSFFFFFFFFFLKKLLLHHDVYGNCVRSATACHALWSRERSRAGFQGFLN